MNEEIMAPKNLSHLTSAYENFKNRLTLKYLIAEDINNVQDLEEKLEMIPGNITQLEWETKQGTAYLGAIACCIPLIYYNTRTKFEVQANSFALVESTSEEAPKTKIYGPGFHFLGRYYNLLGIYSFTQQYDNNIIISPVGDLQVAMVDQGTIMHLEYGGQNIILPPGVHKITDPLIFKKVVTLDTFYIEIGPEKWVTIPDGYDGISVNLGELQILKSGKQHHLSHVGDKFVKMVPKTLLTDRIPTDIPNYVKNLRNQTKTFNLDDPSVYLHTTTAEGSTVTLDAMLFWKIIDTEVAAKTAMEILNIEDSFGANNNSEEYHIRQASANINFLRQTVLRIVKNHLTAQVGKCSLTNDSSLGAAIRKESDEDIDEDESDMIVKKKDDSKVHSFDMLNFLQSKQSILVALINKDLSGLGVKVDNICIYSVQPSKHIQNELDKQTKARVDANTIIIEANSKRKVEEINVRIEAEKLIEKAKADSRTVQIKAEAQSTAMKLKAKGEAEAIEIVAKARKEEAEQLQTYAIASDLARVREAGEAGSKVFTGENNNFIFGKNPGDALFMMMQKGLLKN